MPPKTITHPLLGAITTQCAKHEVWTTAPVRIGAFDCLVPITAWTKGEEPTPQQIAAMVSMHGATQEFKESVEGYIRDTYMEYDRPAYRKTIGDPRFKHNLSELDLPEIKEPSEIWRIIGRMLSVDVDEQANFSLSFTTTFDVEHNFVLRFENGELLDVVME
ncbi:MAG: hypothetical protein K8R87_01940 [Verrucomicrobia bacterium]|nr:hypothetical protein [Verrucomicrobiota bacterium]